MISFETATNIINTQKILLQPEIAALENCLGRVLAEDVISDINMPPFDKSAMDGYAIRKQDLFEELEVVETIKAGDIPAKIIGTKQCSKIMTGALIPEGADCVIIIEQTKVINEHTIRFTGAKTNINIAFKAEDIKNGDIVLKKGTLIRPQEMAILATVGCVKPLVYKLPRIAIMSTGDEIVEPHLHPENGKIRNSNASQLIGQVKSLGITPDYLGIIEDTEEATLEKVKYATENYDVVLLTGGISMGDFDFVPKVMENAGVELLIKTIAIKPGKPTVFGRKNNSFVFCLPGNPVSSFVVFELFAKDFIKNMYGNTKVSDYQYLTIKEDFNLRPSDRMTFLPVKTDQNNEVIPVNYHGSAHIYALCFADGIMKIDEHTASIKKGDKVYVRPL